MTRKDYKLIADVLSHYARVDKTDWSAAYLHKRIVEELAVELSVNLRFDVNKFKKACGV